MTTVCPIETSEQYAPLEIDYSDCARLALPDALRSNTSERELLEAGTELPRFKCAVDACRSDVELHLQAGQLPRDGLCAFVLSLQLRQSEQ